jgi:predicted small lipoprotein YifL
MSIASKRISWALLAAALLAACGLKGDLVLPEQEPVAAAAPAVPTTDADAPAPATDPPDDGR